MACGDCEHDIVLNGACLACGSTEVLPMVRAAQTGLIDPERLRRGK